MRRSTGWRATQGWARPELNPGHGRRQASVGARAWLTQEHHLEGPAGHPPSHSVAQGSCSQRYSQTHAGIGRKHVDIVLTQRVDDDGLAPVHQVSRKLENLWAEGAWRTLLGGQPTRAAFLTLQPPPGHWAQASAAQRFLCSEQQAFLSLVPVWFGTVSHLGPCAVLGSEERSHKHRGIWGTQDHRGSSAEQGAYLDILAETSPSPHREPMGMGFHATVDMGSLNLPPPHMLVPVYPSIPAEHPSTLLSWAQTSRWATDRPGRQEPLRAS